MKKISENSTAENHHERNMQVASKLSSIALKSVIAAAQTCFIPVVSAAKPEEPPKRPCPMRYKDLPLYDCPHYKYKEHENDKCSCEDRKTIHELFAPRVSECRKQVANGVTGFKKELADTYKEVSGDVKKATDSFLKKMRCEKNKNTCALFVTAGGLLGLRMGKTIPRRLFLSGLGLFLTGSVCFPKKTDESARTLMYMLGKAFVPLYNFYFGSDWVPRERVPCERDLPAIPPPTKPWPDCQPKK